MSSILFHLPVTIAPRIRVRPMPALLRRLTACTALAGGLVVAALNMAAIGAAQAAEVPAPPSSAAEMRERFTPLIAGAWASAPGTGDTSNLTYMDLHADGTGTIVIRIKLPNTERAVVSRVAWSVGVATDKAVPVLRIRYIRSTDPVLMPGSTAESTILEASRLTLRTQTKQEEPQSLERLERLPGEILARIALARLPEATTKE